VTDILLNTEHGVTVAKRRTSEQLLQDSGPYASLLRDLMQKAKSRGASDVHIEPHERGVDLRLRIDGNLMQERTVEIEHRESLILEAKRIFGLSIGVSGRPQDGRASISSLQMDVRVSLLPTHFGEKIVMRLLDLDATFELDRLGFLETELATLKNAIALEDGVVVVSGPTGSGKSRTLYACLKAVDPKRYNIVTLEDPIEYRIDGLNQVQVNRKMSFADALRSVLRQDPDVILVGEVRDAETAKLCFQAAETGHLVFTTLHANGAIEVMERFAGLGIDRMVMESNLRLAIAQRLEQRLCPQCARQPTAEVTQWLARHNRSSVAASSKARQRFEQGCSNCCAGIRGRVPILEWATLESVDGKRRPQIHQTIEEARLVRALRGEIDSLEVSRVHL
jgi:type II secretory ATPase GspE/PulE/Tfp pilus assembly ATPase PilB-like protein